MLLFFLLLHSIINFFIVDHVCEDFHAQVRSNLCKLVVRAEAKLQNEQNTVKITPKNTATTSTSKCRIHSLPVLKGKKHVNYKVHFCNMDEYIIKVNNQELQKKKSFFISSGPQAILTHTAPVYNDRSTFGIIVYDYKIKKVNRLSYQEEEHYEFNPKYYITGIEPAKVGINVKSSIEDLPNYRTVRKFIDKFISDYYRTPVEEDS